MKAGHKQRKICSGCFAPTGLFKIYSHLSLILPDIFQFTQKQKGPKTQRNCLWFWEEIQFCMSRRLYQREVSTDGEGKRGGENQGIKEVINPTGGCRRSNKRHPISGKPSRFELKRITEVRVTVLRASSTATPAQLPGRGQAGWELSREKAKKNRHFPSPRVSTVSPCSRTSTSFHISEVGTN